MYVDCVIHTNSVSILTDGTYETGNLRYHYWSVTQMMKIIDYVDLRSPDSTQQ